MKNTLANIILFAALVVGFSSFTACNSASSEKKGANIEVAANDAGSAPHQSKGSDFPPLPTGLATAEIKDLEGKTYKLEDKKGKVVLVNLWAIWCGPCIAEMPHLKEMQDKYRDKGFEVIGLNTGDDDGNTESVEKIKPFVEQQKLNYQIGYADEKFFSQMLKITRMAGIPQSILVNREGRYIGVFKGGGPVVVSEMKQAVDKAMSE